MVLKCVRFHPDMEARRALEDIARRSGGVFRARDVAGAGIHWRDLYALRDEGALVELSRGIFRFADAEMISELDLVAVSKRSPRGTICLNSALSFWDLTDEVPAEVHLAVPRGSRPPSIDYPPTHVHVFAAHTFELGREQVRLESGEEIHIYSPERSVVDAVRLRGQVGTGVAYEALRRYLRRSGSSPGELLRLARRLRAGGPVADALEVLTG
jgi:predicted transcriptional regulator of viral defense system